MTFEELNLNKHLLKALADQEFEYTTPIQAEAFSIIMSGKNVVGVAQTGTGKTLAYLLPIIRQLSFSKQREAKVLILAPTHELVIQIWDEIKKLTEYSGIRSLGVFGGSNINKQKQAVYDGCDILVGTPGRLLDLAYTGVLSLKSIQKLVIDEVDEMLSLGFRTQIKNLLEMLPERRQNLLFSATLTDEVEAMINEYFIYAERIIVTPHGTPLDKIVQKAYHIPNFYTKVNLLNILLEDTDLQKVLVFSKTKKMADRLFEKINPNLPNQIGVIHSNKAHNTRMNAVKNFQEGKHRVLIATDVIARGMDIKDVTHIINFDMPESKGDYIHRIGRTGRANKDGVAISFINEVERAYQLEIEELMGMNISIEVNPEDLAISEIFADDEIPSDAKPKVKQYLKEPDLKQSKGAFHEKKEKNKKSNSVGPRSKKRQYTKSGKHIKQHRKR
ncbi:MAG: ATP-dependent helicase [Bacteroidetes bacterium]|nr:MAG: ATP-dependent helicase [Bacteroidota bacterium]